MVFFFLFTLLEVGWLFHQKTGISIIEQRLKAKSFYIKMTHPHIKDAVRALWQPNVIGGTVIERLLEVTSALE